MPLRQAHPGVSYGIEEAAEWDFRCRPLCFQRTNKRMSLLRDVSPNSRTINNAESFTEFQKLKKIFCGALSGFVTLRPSPSPSTPPPK